MKIAYLLDRPELCGGVKVVFQHATLLFDHGFSVDIIGIGKQPDWISFPGRYIDLAEHTPARQSYDIVITTYWSTIEVAEQLELGPIVHYCQGYEASHPHLEAQWEDIRTIYKKRYPCFAVSDFLAEFLSEEFDKNVFVVPPCIDNFFTPSLKTFPKEPFKVLVSGIFEASWKGVEVALNAIRTMRLSGIDIQVTRISLIPTTSEEKKILEAENYVIAAHPEVIAEITRSADIVLFASSWEEGFGLPLLEAMASGVPVVASDIPSARQITKQQFALLEPSNSDAFAREAMHILTTPEVWQQRKSVGLELSHTFQKDNVSQILINAIEWGHSHCTPT